MPRTILLIDGDQYLHRACAAVERDERWDDENHVLYSNCVEAWEVVEGSIEKVLSHFGEKDHVICLSEGRIFRKDIDPSYKAARSVTRKPLCFHALKEKLVATRKCVSFPTLEADDVMGILATKPGPDNKIIVAQDKDMKTIPAKVWDGYKFYNITEEQANYWHLYQTLVGDTSDGYKGCPGVGPKKAEALLKTVHADDTGADTYVWAVVVKAFEKAGLTEADALRNARLARILRWSDWCSETKTPKLWTPPST
jgi:5'-3' exonuclease